jgi:hypothetical protein
MTPPRLFFSLLLLGQHSLQHIAGLGDMREIDFRLNALRGTRRRGTGLAAGARSAIQMHANLLRLVLLQGTGVGLALRQVEFR